MHKLSLFILQEKLVDAEKDIMELVGKVFLLLFHA